MRYLFGFICVCALATIPVLGCGGNEDEAGGGSAGARGPGGAGGNGGTGGADGIPIPLPQCVASAYEIVFRGFVEPLDPLLRYMDTPSDQRDADQKPPIVSLSELKGLTSPEGDAIYSRFTWFANDVPGVSDPGATLITADFIDGKGLNPADLDNGIYNQQVVLLPWQMTVGESTVVGAGRMSVSGLGNDAIRMTIIDFNPWYEGWANYCHFEIQGFDFYLDLATPGSEPYGVVIGFTAMGNGYSIENGAIIFGTGDTASFTGGYKLGDAEAIPFDLEIDYSTEPAAITGTVGGLPAGCTIDLDTFDVRC